MALSPSSSISLSLPVDTATALGSLSTIPLPLMAARVFTVPRSNATASPNISLKNFIPSIEIPPCDLHKKVFPYIVTDIPSGFAFGRRL